MGHGRFFALDGLRGIAAFSVVLFHLGLWTSHSGFFAHGYLAVDFFYCLSGFVVALAYGDRLGTTMTVRSFVRIRIERLYPIIALGTILGAAEPLATLAFGSHHDAKPLADIGEALLLGLLMIPMVWGNSTSSLDLYPLNTPFWSLLFEFVANFAWVFGARRLPAWCIYGVSAIACIVLFASKTSLNLIGGDAGRLTYGLARVSLGFSAGLLIYDIFRAKRWTWISGVPLPVLLVVLIAALALPPLGIWYDLGCAILVFPSLTLLGARTMVSPRVKRALAWLGDVSYPLYGVHRPIILALLAIPAHLMHGAQPDLIVITIALFCAIGAGHIAHRYFDQPVHKALSSYRRRRKAEVQTT